MSHVMRNSANRNVLCHAELCEQKNVSCHAELCAQKCLMSSGTLRTEMSHVMRSRVMVRDRVRPTSFRMYHIDNGVTYRIVWFN